jgi:hypothetical protein
MNNLLKWLWLGNPPTYDLVSNRKLAINCHANSAAYRRNSCNVLSKKPEALSCGMCDAHSVLNSSYIRRTVRLICTVKAATNFHLEVIEHGILLVFVRPSSTSSHPRSFLRPCLLCSPYTVRCTLSFSSRSRSSLSSPFSHIQS